VLLADNFFESLLPSLPPPVSTGEFRPTFSSEVLPETPPVLGVNRNGLPALPAASGAPNIRPRTPPAEGVKNRYKGTSEAEWWFTGDQPPPAVIPALTPVRFTYPYPQSLLIRKQHSRPRLYPLLQPPELTGSRYRRGIMIMDENNGISIPRSLFPSARMVAQE